MSTVHVTYEPYPEQRPPVQDVEKPAAAPYLVTPYTELPSEEMATSIALIGPDESRRKAVFAALAQAGLPDAQVHEFCSYPTGLEDLPRMLDERNDVILIDLDSNVEAALSLVEGIRAYGTATVMVYSGQANPELLMRCMRAGAREFLVVPLAPEKLAEAMARAAARRPMERQAALPRNTGKLLVFMGAKGGVGVTSVATNYAVALAQDAKKKTLLIDLDLPLGDAALNLGIVAEFSTINALQEADRLDGAFLSRLLVKHSSGLSVLAAPGRFPHYEPSHEALAKLLTVARKQFDYVVVDVGSRVNLPGTVLFTEASTIYLVTQAGIPELRNSNRLISQLFSHGGPHLEVVLNRYESRTIGVSEAQITKALTRPAQWRVPNDHGLVRKMQIKGSPLVLDDNAVAKTIREMALSVNGPQPVEKPKKKVFSFFG